MSEKTIAKEQKSDKNSEDFSFTNKKPISSRHKDKKRSSNKEELVSGAKGIKM